MKVLHILSSMAPEAGGVSQAVKTMISGLAAFDVTNAVVCLDPQDSGYLANSTFRIFALGQGSTAWNYQRKLSYWLKTNLCRYDAAILHGLWQFQTYALLKNRKFAKQTKLFVMPHGMLDPYFQRAPDRKLKAIRNEIFWRLIERKMINSARGILFTCETEKLLARETFSRYAPKAETVVGLGVASPPPRDESLINGFLSKFPQASNSKGYLLYISRIHPKKGVNNLITAYLEQKKSGTTSLPALVIAGPGLETGYGKQVKKLAAGDPAILFTGMLTGDLKWGAFYGCEAFILPSHQENFGIAVVEAMACGKPVLISNQVNIWREIQQEGGGLVTDDTAAGVASLLDSWLKLDKRSKIAMAKAAVKAYDTHFSVKVAAEQLKKALSKNG